MEVGNPQRRNPQMGTPQVGKPQRWHGNGECREREWSVDILVERGDNCEFSFKRRMSSNLFQTGSDGS